MAEMALLPVFKLVEDLADQTAAAVRGDRAIEVEGAMFAVRATEGLRDRAGKWLGTFRAEGRNDPGRALPAISAEIFGAIDIRRTNDTGRRVKERRRSGKNLR